MRVLFVDNFDSFTYNLVEYVSEHQLEDGTRPETVVLKNTASVSEIRAQDPDAIVVSPGPGHPANERDVGVSEAVFQDLSAEIPVLGVCLGMETAVYTFGGEIGLAPEPVHGKAYPIHHDGTGLFEGVPDRFMAGRYHSLTAVGIPDAFEVTATTEQSGVRLPMAIRHRHRPIFGVQFHPESVLTGPGHDIIANFLGVAGAGSQPSRMREPSPGGVE